MPSSEAAAGRFMAWAAGVTAAAGVAFLLLTFAIDPFEQLPGPQFCASGIKVVSTAAKQFVSIDTQPKEILVGTSRVDRGFLKSDLETVLGRPVANLGVPGATMVDVDRLARSAMSVAPVRRLWIGVDFGMFVPGAAEHERSALANAKPARLDVWRQALLNPASAHAVLEVLRWPSRCHEPAYASDGFLNTAPPKVMSRDGLSKAGRAFQRSMTTRANVSGASLDREYRTNLLLLSALIDEARGRGIEVVLFINPSHPNYYEAISSVRLGPRFNTWVEDARGVAKGRARFIDARSLAPVSPECREATPLSCPFADITHYRPTVGRRIIEAALASGR